MQKNKGEQKKKRRELPAKINNKHFENIKNMKKKSAKNKKRKEGKSEERKEKKQSIKSLIDLLFEIDVVKLITRKVKDKKRISIYL